VLIAKWDLGNMPGHEPGTGPKTKDYYRNTRLWGDRNSGTEEEGRGGIQEAKCGCIKVSNKVAGGGFCGVSAFDLLSLFAHRQFRRRSHSWATFSRKSSIDNGKVENGRSGGQARWSTGYPRTILHESSTQMMNEMSMG